MTESTTADLELQPNASSPEQSENRSHRASSSWDTDDPGARGSLRIADKVVEKVASIAAAEIRAVTDQRSGWRLVPKRNLPTANAKVAGGRTRVGVVVAAVWPTPLAELAAETRDHVSQRLVELLGTDVAAVDVTIGDVVHVETERRRVQ